MLAGTTSGPPERTNTEAASRNVCYYYNRYFENDSNENGIMIGFKE